MRILVADDDAVMRHILDGHLTQHEHDVILAEDGAQALALFKQDPFSLVISDWVMPNLDGLQFTRAIRAMKLNTYCYIILLTGREGATSRSASMESGVDAFLSKPFDPDELDLQLNVAERILSYIDHIRKLESLMPVCGYCKRIQNDRKEWRALDEVVAETSKSHFNPSLCPDCLKTQVNPALIPPGMLDS